MLTDSFTFRRLIRASVASAVIAFAALPAAASAIIWSASPPKRFYDGGPRSFSLNVTGTIAHGATVNTAGAPHYLGLVVASPLPNDQGKLLGDVPLGYQPDAVTHVDWNLKVNHRRLGAGTYVVWLEIFDAHGRPSGIPPTPELAFLKISNSGRDSVQMRSLKSLL